MFNRKEIKVESKKNLKRHYFKTILFVFICSIILTGTYNYTTENQYINNQNQNNTETKVEKPKTVYDIVIETVTKTPKNKQTQTKKRQVANGVLAPIVNEVTEKKSIIFGFVNILNKSFFGGKANEILIMFTCTVISLIIAVFIRDVAEIGKNRYFLEQRRYNTKIDKIFFPFKVKRTCHIAYILFTKSVFQFLWDLTIIGGIIKNYEYSMIPYLIAENPNISRKDVFKLSKKLTQGEKWNLFKVDLSMIGWHILGIITLGISSLLFTDAYIECINAEIYMKLRNRIDGEMEKDTYLDIKEYKDEEYPEEKYLIKINTRKWLKVDYDKNYTLTTYIIFFFTFAFVGWLWEVFLHLLTSGTFANRGTLFGPWLPIYGFGIVFILFLLKPFRKQPLKLFILTVILCGILEYSAAWYLETFKHMKWWDYTGYFLNLHGRICFEGLLVFGLGGAAITYLVAPILNNIYSKIEPKIKIIICVILVSLFSMDLVYSSFHPNTGEGVTDSVQK
ncbi:MAG: DUF975 family protein [Bacilli bacterium]|nr:DUF975 family protein [Bacilli bacterium]